MLLTKTKIRALTEPGFYRDSPTLYLKVIPAAPSSDAALLRYWIQRYMFEGTRRDVSLGPWPVVSIEAAREAALLNRQRIRQGIDPRDAKIDKTPTFAEAAEKTIELHRPKWKAGGQTEKHWRACFERHVFPTLGDKRVNRISPRAVLRVIEPLWTSRPEMGRKVRRRMKAVFGWALSAGHVGTNPAGAMLDGALPMQRPVKQHLRALPWKEIPAAIAAVAENRNTRKGLISRACLRFVILTAVRSGEARLARWDEFDLDAATWTIPAARMKAGREHRIPLSEASIAVLQHAKAWRDSSGLVFPSPVKRGAALSDMALTKLLRDMGLSERTTVHGFRSSFRDWCADTGKRRQDAEAALAHAVGGVEGAYFRSDLFDRRRLLMEQWASFATQQAATVISIARKTA